MGNTKSLPEPETKSLQKPHGITLFQLRICERRRILLKKHLFALERKKRTSAGHRLLLQIRSGSNLDELTSCTEDLRDMESEHQKLSLEKWICEGEVARFSNMQSTFDSTEHLPEASVEGCAVDPPK